MIIREEFERYLLDFKYRNFYWSLWVFGSWSTYTINNEQPQWDDYDPIHMLVPMEKNKNLKPMDDLLTKLDWVGVDVEAFELFDIKNIIIADYTHLPKEVRLSLKIVPNENFLFHRLVKYSHITTEVL